MKDTAMKMQRASRPRRAMQGLSLVELMIAMTLGLIVLAALVSVFANSSASRAELERTSRQIENGRFAMELLSDDLRHAGFYGEANVKAVPLPGVMPDPCTTDPTLWIAAMPIHVQAYDNGNLLPPCFVGSRKLNTDVLLVRRVATCEAGLSVAPGVPVCPASVANEHYLQIAKCASETAVTPYVFGSFGATAYPLRMRDCAAIAPLRRYFVRFYFISTDNGQGGTPAPIPTLKRLDLGANGGWVETPLVEGIEELNIEYGIDTDGDGGPDVYAADPNTYVCGGCTAITNWANVVSTRINLLARNLEASPGYQDAKTYSLGRDTGQNEVVIAPSGADRAFRRHVYSGVVRIVNAGERRDVP